MLNSVSSYKKNNINQTVVINEANKDLNLQRGKKRNLGNEVEGIIEKSWHKNRF
jgi:hypothetical protein